jgi:hypothetical protein
MLSSGRPTCSRTLYQQLSIEDSCEELQQEKQGLKNREKKEKPCFPR